ncbi:MULTISPECIES: DUF7673 family protein [Novosphingobium]|uniref:DUF7673 family protein n=1 Tax=Novosphingobium TaxID=165696 RepID=UPI0022F2943E|nr:hypothetical protein [Novosphingobium resinovorum]GLK44526.1 hypothetical protein GCM10017612_24460 [Novosphingobium resinovorum]
MSATGRLLPVRMFKRECGLDRAIGIDIATIIGYLADHPGAVYADAFGEREAMSELIGLWRARKCATT